MRNRIIIAAVLASCVYAATALADDSASSPTMQVTGTTSTTPSTTIGGVAWFDFSSISFQNQNSKGQWINTPPDGIGFDVKRFYLIVDHRFSDVWAADLTTDAQYSTASTATVQASPSGTATALTSQTTSGGVTEVYIKKLYLEGKFDPRFVLRVGSADLPWIPWVESQYGYRYIDKLPLDRLGFGTTADWGLNASGTFGANLLNYSLSVVNGGGYKNPTRTKKVDVEGRISTTPVNWLTLGVGFYDGYLGQVTAANQSFPNNTATRFTALGVVNVAGLRVGVEYWTAKNYKTVNNLATSAFGTSSIVTSSGAPPVNDRAEGWTPFVSYTFTPQWSVFGRYDDVKLSKDVAPSLKDEYYNLGVAYKPIKPLDVALVYKHERVENGSTSISGFDANGSVTIGGATGSYSGRWSEFGLYFAFKY
jgi:hypothetical protein